MRPSLMSVSARLRFSADHLLRDVRGVKRTSQCWSSYPFVDDQHMPVLQAVGTDGKPIVTLASVSQHAETLSFNGGTPTLDAQNLWVSSDWINFFRTALQRRLGGVAIEMAGALGSVESPEVYRSAISRTPQQFVDLLFPSEEEDIFVGPERAQAREYPPFDRHG